MPMLTRSAKKKMSASSKPEIPPEATITVVPPPPPQSPPPPNRYNDVEVIELSDSSVSPPHNRLELSTPMRPVFCVKNKEKMKELESKEECFILDFDPDDEESDPVQTQSTVSDDDESPELCVVGEKGKVACRDYPHSRHLCIKFPFATTPHESVCPMCYCFVCDSSAPCLKWSNADRHCDAIASDAWKLQREFVKLAKLAKLTEEVNRRRR